MQINLTRQTMANWIISASNLTKPIYDEIKKELVSARIIHADETELEVLAEPERRPQTKSYMWVYTTGKSEDKNIILYDYKEVRPPSKNRHKKASKNEINRSISLIY